MKNNIIFMTGASSGLGKISALQAAGNGATVVALVRNKAKGTSLQKEHKATNPNSSGKIEIVEGNLNDLESVRKACLKVASDYPVIDMLINNAGIMNFKPKVSEDNIEETLQVNLIAPLLICDLLLDNLKKSDAAKIIFTSSGLHQGNIHFDNIEFKESFSSFKVYRQSKLGVILVCRLLSKKLKEYDIEIYSQHPGMVRTELGRDAGWIAKMIFYFMGKSPKKGAKTLSFLMESPRAALKSGEYYADCKVTQTTSESYDMEVAAKLLARIQDYLSHFISSKSTIFQNNSIKQL